MGTPIIDAALTRRPFITAGLALGAISVGAGFVVATAIVVLDIAVFARLVSVAPASPPAVWTGALAALYGGLTEEIVLRYGAMSVGVWLSRRLLQDPAAYWAAILSAAALFGLWHLTAVAAAAPLEPLFIFRTVVLNGIAGIAFGWLYWRRGLEAAMFSHGTAALILHVAVPSIGM